MRHFFCLLVVSLAFLCEPCWAIQQNKLSYQISGVENPLLENINKLLAVEEQSYIHPLSHEDILTLYQRVPQIIRKAMQPFGYFKSDISTQLVHKNYQWTAFITINRGEKLNISRVDLQINGEGKQNKALLNYLHHFPVHPGDTFLAENYSEAKEKLFALAEEEGYIKATFTVSKVLIDIKQNKATIILHLDTGPRYYFGQFSFTNHVYAPSFLKRFDPHKKMQPFSSKALINYQQELVNSYYFDSVMVTPDFNQIENYQIPINVNVIPPKAKRYSLAVGYGTSGPRFTAGLNLRHLTTTGHHFDAQIKLSPVLSGAVAKYYIPGQNPLTDQWIMSSNFQQFSPKNGMSRSGTLSAGYQTKWHDWQTTFNLNYLLERYKVKNKPTQYSHLLYPNINFSYVKADDLINPHFGKSLNLNLRGASQTALSTTDFIQAQLKGKYLFSPIAQGRFILRGDLGYLIVKDLDALPSSMRFFAGGLNSIRTFKDSSIGPGRYLVVGSIEYQHKIKGNWNGALFYDAGTATNHFDTAFNQSKGIGVIYDSMIGPIKFYVGQKNVVPVDNARKKTYGIELSIGPEF